MVSCRIVFLKRVLGMGFPVAGGSIVIRAARDTGRAVEAAKLKFARSSQVESWTHRADSLAVEPMEAHA